MKLKLTTQLLLVDSALQLLPVAYFTFTNPSFVDTGLNAALIHSAFYLFIIWKISSGSNLARFLFLGYTLIIFLPLSVRFLMVMDSVGMGVLVLIQLGIRAYCLYQLFFTPTKLAFKKVKDPSSTGL